jgi:hypothetical protein
MNPRKHSLLRAILSNIHFLGQCTLMAREQVMSDQHVTKTPWNLIPALLDCYYQTVTSCVQGKTLNSWQSMHQSEMKRSLFCLVSSRPMLDKGLKTIHTMGHGKFGLSVCLEFPNPDELRSTMFCCCSCMRFPQATLIWERCHTKPGHLPPGSSWLSWLP